VTVAIDTSGSMGTEEMTTALRETKGILNATGAQVEIIAADTRVTDVKKVQRVDDVRKLLKGGGGTDFRPVFELLERRSSGRPDVVIYMTDGYGPAPARPPAGMLVIWLLMGRWGHKKPCNWGEVLEVKATKRAS
jgi:predicted metal-dependent peptidase